jgi:hypothetical protein
MSHCRLQTCTGPIEGQCLYAIPMQRLPLHKDATRNLTSAMHGNPNIQPRDSWSASPFLPIERLNLTIAYSRLENGELSMFGSVYVTLEEFSSRLY